MAKFKIATVVGAFAKQLGKEEIFVELTEWDMQSLIELTSKYKKPLYRKIKKELIDEAIKEGYDLNIVAPLTKTTCPNCKEEIWI